MSRSNYAPREEYLGDGTLATYTFDFKIEELSQLLVVTYNTLNVEQQRVRGTDTSYLSSVTYDPVNGGGTVNLLVSLPFNYKIVFLQANDAPTQPSEFRSKTSLTTRTLETALDWIAGAVQRIAYLSQRSVKLNDADDVSAFDPTLPPALASNPRAIFCVNLTGTGMDIGPTMDDLISWRNAAIAAAAAAAASAMDAATHEANALTYRNDASASASGASSSATAAATSATAAAGSATNSAISALSSQSQATAAAGSATASAGSASASATSATNAATSEANASSYKNAAATSATNAATSETNAATSEANAAASAAAAIAASSTPVMTGSRGVPQNITAAGGLPFTGSAWLNTWFIQGSGGAVDITSVPQIAAASAIGQRLRIRGRSASNTIIFDDGDGLVLNGMWMAELDNTLELEWDGTNWVECFRS